MPPKSTVRASASTVTASATAPLRTPSPPAPGSPCMRGPSSEQGPSSAAPPAAAAPAQGPAKHTLPRIQHHWCHHGTTQGGKGWPPQDAADVCGSRIPRYHVPLLMAQLSMPCTTAAWGRGAARRSPSSSSHLLHVTDMLSTKRTASTVQKHQQNRKWSSSRFCYFHKDMFSSPSLWQISSSINSKHATCMPIQILDLHRNTVISYSQAFPNLKGKTWSELPS